LGVDAERLVARLDLRLAALRERAAGLREVADVAVGQRQELHLRSLRREQRRRPSKLLLRIVGMRAHGDDAQRTVRRDLRADGLEAEDGDERERAAHTAIVSQ